MYDSDNRRLFKYLRASLSAVFDNEALMAVADAENTDIGYFTAPFDYMDKICSYLEKSRLCYSLLLKYEDTDLSSVLKSIHSINIVNVTALWINFLYEVPSTSVLTFMYTCMNVSISS